MKHLILMIAMSAGLYAASHIAAHAQTPGGRPWCPRNCLLLCELTKPPHVTVAQCAISNACSSFRGPCASDRYVRAYYRNTNGRQAPR